jgi:hypothetical protein
MKERKSVHWYKDNGVEVTDTCVTREGVKPVPESPDWKQTLCEHVKKEDKLTKFEIVDGVIKCRCSDEEYLKKQNKEDPRGTYYHKGREKQNVTIYNIDAHSPGDDYTKEEPLPDEPYQVFNDKSSKWEVNIKKKKISEKEAELGRLKSEIAEAEKNRLRSKFAIDDDEATEDDYKFNAEYKAQIAALRPQIKEAEKELKKLKSA